MILSDIRRYLRENKQASLTELAQHFAVEPEALRCMLDHLIAKGYIYADNVAQINAAQVEEEQFNIMQIKEKACGKKSLLCGGCSLSCSARLCPPSQKPEIFKWAGANPVSNPASDSIKH